MKFVKVCSLFLPLRTLLHEEVSVSSMSVTPGVDDGAARGEIDILLSLSGVPESPLGEVMMDLQLACLLVVGQLAANATVWTTGGILSTLCLHITLQSRVIIIIYNLCFDN